MDESEIKNLEKKIDSDYSKLGSEIKKEEKLVEKEIEKTHAEKTAITEIELEINAESIKRFGRVLYDIFIAKKVLFYVILALAVIIGFEIRIASLPALGASPLIGNNYLNVGGSLSGLDPYIFYIEAVNILHFGNVPLTEHLEYLPIGYPARVDRYVVSFFGAYAYNLLHFIEPSATLMTWFMVIPPFTAIFMTILLFFIILELFNDYWAASIGALMFPAFQTLLSRAVAGFSDKEMIGFMFMLLAILMIIKLIKSKNVSSKVVFGFMLALATGLTGASTGYVQYLALGIPAVFIALIMLDFAKKGDLYAFLPFGLWILFTESMVYQPISSLLTNIIYLPTYFVYLLILFKLFVYDKYKSKLKIPFVGHGVSLVVYSGLVAIGLLGVTGLNRLFNIFSTIVSEIAYPLGIGQPNPVSLTVAEYAPQTLAQRICDYNFFLGSCGDPNTIGLNLILFYGGMFFLLYLIAKRFKHGNALYLFALPIIMLLNGGTFTPGNGSNSLVALFSFAALLPLVDWAINRKKSQRKISVSVLLVLILVSMILSVSFSGINQTTNYYKYAAIAFAVLILIWAAFDKLEDDAQNKPIYLVMLIFFVLTMALSNLETWLIQITELIAAVLIPFAIVFMTRSGVTLSRMLFKKHGYVLFAGAIIILAIAFVAYDLYTSLNYSYAVAQSSGSGLALWGPSLLWVNQNTPYNSTLISWWDYGYWEEAIGNRTTVADGSNAFGYQSMIAKYFFEATSPYQYATYLNFVHQPTYAVISGSEVLKFSAISTIALNYTQFTPMTQSPSSALNTQNIGNKSYKYLAIFGGNNAGIGPVEQNMVVNGEPWNSSETLLVNVLIPFNYTNGTYVEGPPYGVVYNPLTQQLSNALPINNYCVYGSGCVNESNSGIPGAIMLLNGTDTPILHIGGYSQFPGGYATAPINMQAYGNSPSLLYMPQKSLNTLFVKLYLLNETVPGFKLVFTDNLPADSLLSIENQVLTNINIYQINYTALQKYMLTGQCSIDTSAQNYCANLNYLPGVYFNNTQLISGTPI